jgi:hypothetical protein
MKSVPEQLAEAYQQVFGTTQRSRAQMLVLADLAYLCRARLVPFDMDAHLTAMRCGRLEVWQRISNAIEPALPTVAEILGNPAMNTEDDNNA